MPDKTRAGLLDRAGKRKTARFGDGFHERAPHAPARARHHNPHIGHRKVSNRRADIHAYVIPGERQKPQGLMTIRAAGRHSPR